MTEVGHGMHEEDSETMLAPVVCQGRLDIIVVHEGLRQTSSTMAGHVNNVWNITKHATGVEVSKQAGLIIATQL